jgi:hypothetical protein
MRVSVPNLATLRSENRLSRLVINSLLPSESQLYVTPNTFVLVEEPLTEHKHMSENLKVTAHALRQQKAGICSMSTLWHIGVICAVWLDLYWLSRP